MSQGYFEIEIVEDFWGLLFSGRTFVCDKNNAVTLG